MKDLEEILIDNWIKEFPEYEREECKILLKEDSIPGRLTRSCLSAMKEAVNSALQESAKKAQELIDCEIDAEMTTKAILSLQIKDTINENT